MHWSTTLIPLSLAAILTTATAANAHSQHPQPREFIHDPNRIVFPLEKRRRNSRRSTTTDDDDADSSATAFSTSNDDGTVNFDATEFDLKTTYNKYTHQRYPGSRPKCAGKALFSPNITAGAMDNLFGNWSHKNTHKNSKRGNIGMTEVEDYMWSVRVTIGTPAQTFFLVPDTGSGEILVPDSSCSTSSCGSTTSRYTKSASSTAVDQNRGAVNSYSFGLQNSGEVIKDTVTIAGSTVTSQQFVSCKTMSSALLAIPDVDGLLGLGYAPLAASGATPFPFSNQAANGGNYFAMRLSDTYGYSELSMGNIDRARVGGQVHSFNVGLNANTGALKYWQIGLSSPNINGGAAVFGSRKTMIFDSGSNYIYAPPADAATFYAQVPGSAQLESGSNTYWTYPCANPPTVTFTFGRTIGFAWNKYAVNQNDFNLGLAAAGSSLCVGAVVGIDLNLGGWVLGTAFLKNWLVVYNMELNQISLAEPKDRQPTYIP